MAPTTIMPIQNTANTMQQKMSVHLREAKKEI